jgi:hypothetical protein
MNKIDIVLGDWSDDGHGKSDKVTILINKTPSEMKQAYKASCKALGISFNHNDDFTGITDSSYEEQKMRHICSDYEDSTLNSYCYKILSDNCFQYISNSEVLDKLNDDGEDEDNQYLDDEDLIEILMAFITYSMTDFKWKYPEAGEKIPVFNGYWDDELNVQIGYGLYY